jgi:hypothetical protein
VFAEPEKAAATRHPFARPRAAGNRLDFGKSRALIGASQPSHRPRANSKSSLETHNPMPNRLILIQVVQRSKG